jgi:tetratricopeptide (TPR) repeat protein
MSTDLLAAGDRRLNSWKEIGSFFNRDERTVKRWEVRRGLPIHRIPGPGNTKVFGYVGELTAWLNSGTSAQPEPAHPARAERLASPRRTPDPRAREHYLAGMYYYNLQTPVALSRALEHFSRASAIDPDDAGSHVGLGACYALQHDCGQLSAARAYAIAGAAAERAIALDDRLSEAHSLLGAVRFHGQWDVAGALAAFDRSLTLNPNSWQSRRRHAVVLLHVGRHDAALAEITAAQTINPVYRPVLADKGRILIHCGRQADAAMLLTPLADVAPGFAWPHAWLAELHLDRGDYGAYLDAAHRVAMLRDERCRRVVLRSARRALGRGGRTEMAQALFAGYRRLQAADKAGFYDLAQARALAGDGAAAIELLQAAHARREPRVLELLIDPAFAECRHHVAFQRLVGDVGLAPT